MAVVYAMIINTCEWGAINMGSEKIQLSADERFIVAMLCDQACCLTPRFSQRVVGHLAAKEGCRND
ncbi:MAG: hypothetical protein D6694_15360 [Gammaproteobacteria bacterium]|nr:MAG: hypothetical protein D6694_15360 [Gammaproteobacteria bacterium]